MTAMKAFKDGAYADTPVERPDLQVDFAQLSALMGLTELDAMETKYEASD